MSQIALQSPFGVAASHLPQQWAHDIRNVLATIAIRLNTLESLSGPTGSHAADSIHDLIAKARSLCDQAIVPWCNTANKRISVELTAAVEQVADIVLPTAPQGFRIEISRSTLLSALIDPTDLFRIIFNLFHNAVSVAQEQGNLSTVRVHVGELAQRVVLDVSDNGPGLPARVKRELFRPRPRRFGRKLRGFGLSIARELAERNGGSLKLLETNAGAHFRLNSSAVLLLSIACQSARQGCNRFGATKKGTAMHIVKSNLPGQIVLVLQGGGALGSYQAGVYQALHEAGIEPDWIIGTSIGAINASLIAGNEPQSRLAKLREFWQRVEQRPFWNFPGVLPSVNDALSYWATINSGIPGFFALNPFAQLGAAYPLGPDRAGYYSTAPLRETLLDLVDFSLVNQCSPRLTVGAAHVGTSQMRYFDSRDTELGVEHIMASGALPPAFPPVRIDGELYWDGGILSNTPTEAVFDDNPRKNSVIFAVHMWNPTGPEPETMADVFNRQKDIQYSSRIATHIARQQQTHRLRHVISELVGQLPEHKRKEETIRELAAYGCPTRMHVVRLLAPMLERENHTKDIDFSASGIRQRWEAGYTHTIHVLEQRPWDGEFDPLAGVILHEREDLLAIAAE